MIVTFSWPELLKVLGRMKRVKRFQPKERSTFYVEVLHVKASLE